MEKSAYKINISGIVQGVGFRPFIYRLAKQYNLLGNVSNTSKGVQIIIEGKKSIIDNFIKSIEKENPKISLIKSIDFFEIEYKDIKTFTIEKSKKLKENSIFISPDLSTCADCKEDILNKKNRRYYYPFTTCTYCGPRYSIIRDIPYDRKSTVMDEFIMCPECQKEYDNPDDRRYHSQPNACSKCGPKLSLFNTSDKKIIDDEHDDYIKSTADVLKQGKIVAIKGLGGYLLCCDAYNSDTIKLLRKNKQRDQKPFAIMCKDIKTILNHCHISPGEKEVLLSPNNPIVLLKKRKGNQIAQEVSCDNDYLGVMLPYTPIHLLLMEEINTLVMTSANISDMPIIMDDIEAMSNLSCIADYILMHDRKIHSRVDDSVYKVINKLPQAIRRARGYAPGIIKAEKLKKPILAVGGERKNTFALNRGENIFVSQHIGDLKCAETYDLFCESINEFKRLFGLSPKIAACDMHPDYLSTKWAEENYDNVIKVQHHHAHLAGTLLEYGLCDEEAIGFVMDGTGYGSDGAIWGCESGIVSFKEFKRRSHLNYFYLPGGDKCSKDIYRCAISLLNQTIGNIDTNQFDFAKSLDRKNIQIIREMITYRINSIPSSSMGRFFDGISCILGLGNFSDYEASAAIRLESIADENITDKYTVTLQKKDNLYIWMWENLLLELLVDIENKVAVSVISSKFHNSVVEYILKMSQLLSYETGLKKVVLSGGVFYNSFISSKTENILRKHGFEVYLQRTFPAGDGGLCIGQLIVANEVI